MIRNLNFSEVGVIESFFDERWRKNHIFKRNRPLLDWFYRDSPYREKYSEGYSVRASFDNDGSLIGFFGYIPFLFNYYGKKEWGCYLSAWWVDPNQKATMLSLRMLNELQNHMGFSICISGMNTSAADAIYKALRWNVIDNMPRWVLCTSLEKMKKLMGDNDVPSLFDDGSQVDADKCPTFSSDLKIKEIDQFEGVDNDQWNKFYWSKLAQNYFGPAKELIYLKWRYRDIPEFKYSKLALFDGEEIIGIIIYRHEVVKNTSIGLLRIVDILCESGNSSYLLGAVRDMAVKLDCAMVDFISTGQYFDAALIKIGFKNAVSHLSGNYIYPYLFQPLNLDNIRLNTAYWLSPVVAEQRVFAHDDYRLVKGDYEFDRPT